MPIPKTLYLVIPCFNEEEALPVTAACVAEELSAMITEGLVAVASKIVFVDDGSKDKTWQIITEAYGANPMYVGIRFSANFGHQNAILAGMMYAKEHADIVITMDADLQDDIKAIGKMVKSANEGNDIVYGVRNDRSSDSFFKRSSAQGFYKFMRFMGVDLVYNHADFRLMSRQALEALADYQEVNLFLRGLIPLMASEGGGFKSSVVEYERKERFAGASKYPLPKMLSFAWQGISSFSIRPIRFVSGLGMFMIFTSIAAFVYTIIQHVLGNTEPGWASLVISIWTVGGIQLFAIGIIGEYIGKTYLESKRRPRYIIERIIGGD